MNPCPRCARLLPFAWSANPCKACAEELARLARPREQVLRESGVPEKYWKWEDLELWPTCTRNPAVDLSSWSTYPWSVLLAGPFGTGKTTLAAELLYRFIRGRKERGSFIRASEIPRLAYNDAEQELYVRMRGAPILIIDDLGRGYTGNAGMAVSEVAMYRYDRALPTIFTTNVEDVAAIGDGALLDRLHEGLSVRMEGESRR